MVTTGRVAALLELGAGFNPEFTGRENVFLNGEIMGLSRGEIARALPSIAAFADIGEFLERPVKEYSSGMYVRLAFATAIHVEPEILVVDEALAVGDAVFANRCVRKFEELRERKITVLFVSHDLGLVKQLSHRAILLVGGHIHAQGEPNQVINQYIGLVLEKQRAEVEPRSKLTAGFRHGDLTSEVLEVQLLGEHGEPVRAVSSGEALRVRPRSVDAASPARAAATLLRRLRHAGPERGHEHARQHAAAHEPGPVPVELSGRQVVDVPERDLEAHRLVHRALDVASVPVPRERIRAERGVVEVVDESFSGLDADAPALGNQRIVPARDLEQGGATRGGEPGDQHGPTEGAGSLHIRLSSFPVGPGPRQHVSG